MDTQSIVSDDYTVKIPRDLAEKFGFLPGSEIIIYPHPEDSNKLVFENGGGEAIYLEISDQVSDVKN